MDVRISNGNDLPECVVVYLTKKEELAQVSQRRRVLTEELKNLEPEVCQWLATATPQAQVELEFPEEQESALGQKGKIRIKRRFKRESISKKVVFKYLCEFFQKAFSDRPPKWISEAAEAAIKHVWESRQKVELKPGLARTYNKKRKFNN